MNYYEPRYMGEFLKKEFVELEKLSFRSLSSEEIRDICKIFTVKRGKNEKLTLAIVFSVITLIFSIFVIFPALSGAYFFSIFAFAFYAYVMYGIISSMKTSKVIQEKLENREGRIASCIAYAPDSKRERRNDDWETIYTVELKNENNIRITRRYIVLRTQDYFVKYMMFNKISEAKFWIIDFGDNKHVYLISNYEFEALNKLTDEVVPAVYIEK